MATTMNKVVSFVAECGGLPERFEPFPFYERHTDSLIIYFEDTPSYGNRLNQLFTLFLADSDDRLVGIEIKGFKRLLDRVKDTGLLVSATNSTVKLECLARLAFVPEPELPDLMQLMSDLKRFDVDVNVPELVG